MKGETVRHKIATSKYNEKNQMLFILHAVGGTRCHTRTDLCTDGCMPMGKFDGVPPESSYNSRSRTSFDDFLDSNLFAQASDQIG